MLFAQYMCCSPSMEVQIEETETGNRSTLSLNSTQIYLQITINHWLFSVYRGRARGWGTCQLVGKMKVAKN